MTDSEFSLKLPPPITVPPTPSEQMAFPLIRAAKKARQNAYAPYSHFTVGAALLCADGYSVFGGCNQENASFSAGICAERAAFAAAVSAGHHTFAALALIGGREKEEPTEFCTPCGICRQVMAEFCAPYFPVILAISEKEYQIVTLEQLFPFGFSRADLQRRSK